VSAPRGSVSTARSCAGRHRRSRFAVTAHERSSGPSPRTHVGRADAVLAGPRAVESGHGAAHLSRYMCPQPASG
jgi:hypothetical protein